MKNSILNNKIMVDFNGFSLSPTYSVNIPKLREFMKNNLSMFYVKEMNDNVRFEVLALREYNDSSLWDILMILNFGENGILNFAKGDTWVSDNAENQYKEQQKYFSPNFKPEDLYNQILSKIQKKNESRRKVIFIKRQFIPQFKESIKDMLNVF
ncbi:hypothetical protein PC5_00168 [Campylobacter phage PC5]|uniref:Uncharacterized protein n=1 Tax=Campylobacter phage PC5 TaxID=1541690 RepID=A0A1B0XVW2_9CAUD|nr:hypothetical protein PC5_00168 [Campylobacter phage PC5]